MERDAEVDYTVNGGEDGGLYEGRRLVRPDTRRGANRPRMPYFAAAN